MDNYQRHLEEQRARQLRQAIYALAPLDRKDELKGATMPAVNRVRFIAEGPHVDQATLEGRIINLRLRAAVELRVSLRAEPFAKLVSIESNKCMGKWPLFPALGGENGLAMVLLDRCNVDVEGHQGKLTFTFFPLPSIEPPQTRIQQALEWVRSRIFKSRPRIESHSVVVGCTRDSKNHLEFSVQTTGDWKAA